MRTLIILGSLLASIVTTSPLLAQQSVVDQLRTEQQQNLAQMKSDFNTKVDKMQDDYNKEVELMREEHQKFIDGVKQKWGDQEPVETTAKKWVEYSDDESTRSVVDFESGEVQVEVLLSDSDFDSDGNILQEKLERAVATALSSKGHTLEYDSKYEQRTEVSKTAILEDLIDLTTIGGAAGAGEPDATVFTANSSSTLVASSSSTKKDYSTRPAKKTPTLLGAAPPVSTRESPKQKSVKEEPKKEEPKKEEPKATVKQAPVAIAAQPIQPQKVEVETLAAKIVKSSTPVITTQKSSDGSTKKVATIDLKLVDNHLSKSASAYRSIVAKYSKRYDIAEPVLFAIMEQESAFNPVAKSWVPAYGLMQLVPTSGGRDAYNYVHKEDKIVSGNYLYNPDNNIELGAAYFKILKTRNFQKVTDPQCQLLCMVAAYNCGAGNVSRAFTGNTNISKAIPQINNMNYDQLYSHLRKNLPDETKDYIYKITRNINKYTAK